MPRTPLPLAERLARYDVDPETGCWVFRQIAPHGYGVLMVGGRTGRLMYAHRLSYEHHVGPIPDGMVLDHLCRNKACIRPSHLDPVPQRTNIHRGASPTARNATATECIHGHPFDAENTYWRPDGKGRLCRACGRDRKMRAKLARATLRGYT